MDISIYHQERCSRGQARTCPWDKLWVHVCWRIPWSLKEDTSHYYPYSRIPDILYNQLKRTAALLHRSIDTIVAQSLSHSVSPLSLFAQWDVEDDEMTQEEIAEAQRDYAEFTQRLNAERARVGARLLYP